MKRAISTIIFGAMLSLGTALADESKTIEDSDAQSTKSSDVQPVKLSDTQMDQISAGSLLLPNGKVQHELFDNPAPNVNGYFGACDVDTGLFCHPALTRRSDQVFVAVAEGSEKTVVGFPDGPWSATSASPMIGCVGADIPAGTGPNGTGTGCAP